MSTTIQLRITKDQDIAQTMYSIRSRRLNNNAISQFNLGTNSLV